MVRGITPADIVGWDQGHITFSGVLDDNLGLILWEVEAGSVLNGRTSLTAVPPTRAVEFSGTPWW
jgi:hypothetical protein